MSVNDTINSLIAPKPNTLATLDGLIAQLQSETLATTDPFTNAPTVDSTGLWTLAQTTYNTTDNLYIGVYTISGSLACATIDIVSVSNYTAPSSNNVQYRACGTSMLTTVATPNALDGVSANTIIVRSSTPFTVTLRLAAQWCYSIDFAGGKGITDVYLVGNWQAGEGYNAVCFGVISGFSTQPYNVALAINAPLAGTRLTSISMTYNAQPKSATAYVATIRRDSLSNIIKQQPIGSGIDKVITWTGDAVFNSLILTIGLSNGSNPADCNLTSYNGRIKTLTVNDTGACPFGTPTCTA